MDLIDSGFALVSERRLRVEEAPRREADELGAPIEREERERERALPGLKKEAGDASGDGETGVARRKRRNREWLPGALLELKKHPDRSDAYIAKQVGIHRSQLTRCEEYKRMRDAHRGEVRRGYRQRGNETQQGDIDGIDTGVSEGE